MTLGRPQHLFDGDDDGLGAVGWLDQTAGRRDKGLQVERNIMEMFLMVAAISLLGIAVCAALFAAATHDVRRIGPQTARQTDQAAREVAQFFATDADTLAPRVPIEGLLLQIERHSRLEQAAAESFHDAPTSTSPTTRPWATL
jgi:hypothetical protein